MKIGYCRVSTADQSLNLQKDALEKYGCEQFYSDVISGSKFKRNGLSEMFKVLRKGDIVVVYKLDRLGRTTRELLSLVDDLKVKGIDFVSITQNIDTTTPMGKAFFVMSALFAELERDLIIERTKAGLESARARGRFGGRPSITKEKKKLARSLYNDKTNNVGDILKTLDISKSSFYNIINENKELELENERKATINYQEEQRICC